MTSNRNTRHEGAADSCDIVIVGAGFAGIAMLHRTRQLGFRTRLLEAAAGIGGVWYWNRYPGARCDVESLDYSYSFDPQLEQEWHWTEKFAPQSEILAYINHVADRYRLREDITLNTRVLSADYDEAECRWALCTDTGEHITCTYLIMATGTLSVTRLPAVEGLDDFKGEWYHTGQWPHEPVNFAGKRVGIIGVGSSGTQMVAPVAEQAEKLFVFMRTPNFCVPGPNAPMDAEYERAVKANYRARREFTRQTNSGLNRDMHRESALEVSPEARRAHYEDAWKNYGFGFILTYKDLLLNEAANRTAVDFIASKIREVVKDPRVAELLTPKTYPFGTKRPSVDSKYYESFNRDNVTLVDIASATIQRITPSGIRTAAADYELDVIVFATGYDALTGALNAIRFTGRGGATLSEKWAAGPRTYLGLATAGFPNMFIIAGPGSPSVLSNVMVSIEQHVEWVSELLASLRAKGVKEIEAKVEAEDQWVEHVNQLAAATLYPKANSWYLGADVPGKPRVFMPYAGGLRAYRRKCAEVKAVGYAGFTLRGVEERADASAGMIGVSE